MTEPVAKPPAPVPAKAAVPKPSPMPHPARNLGPHLKAPNSGEIVTNHHRGAKGKR